MCDHISVVCLRISLTKALMASHTYLQDLPVFCLWLLLFTPAQWGRRSHWPGFFCWSGFSCPLLLLGFELLTGCSMKWNPLGFFSGLKPPLTFVISWSYWNDLSWVKPMRDSISASCSLDGWRSTCRLLFDRRQYQHVDVFCLGGSWLLVCHSRQCSVYAWRPLVLLRFPVPIIPSYLYNMDESVDVMKNTTPPQQAPPQAFHTIVSLYDNTARSSGSNATDLVTTSPAATQLPQNSSDCPRSNKKLLNENVKVGMLFASKATVQLITNPFIGPLTNR